MPSHYDVLGAGQQASLAELRVAYRRAARAAHPDHGCTDPARMLAVNAAWEVLSDPARRAGYDFTLRQSAQPRPKPATPPKPTPPPKPTTPSSGPRATSTGPSESGSSRTGSTPGPQPAPGPQATSDPPPAQPQSEPPAQPQPVPPRSYPKARTRPVLARDVIAWFLVGGWLLRRTPIAPLAAPGRVEWDGSLAVLALLDALGTAAACAGVLALLRWRAGWRPVGWVDRVWSVLALFWLGAFGPLLVQNASGRLLAASLLLPVLAWWALLALLPEPPNRQVSLGTWWMGLARTGLRAAWRRVRHAARTKTPSS